MIEWIAVPEFAEVRTLNAKGGFLRRKAGPGTAR